jgi:NADPH2:quinone reductase
VQNVDRPEPKKGEVLIQVIAAGISFVDALMSRNKHQNKHEPPFSTGMEVVGEIAALGPEITGFAVGDKVAALVYDGGHAEYVCAKSPEVFALPDECDPVQTAAVLSVALTSELALVQKGQVQPNETVLISGAAGGVGLTGVQLAKFHGAKVIAAVSDAAKAEAAKTAGADAALVYGPDLRDRVKEANGGRDVDIILDPVGGDFAEVAAHCLDWDGRYLIIGFAGGGIPTFAANRLLVKNRSVHGMVLGYYRWQKPARLAEAANVVFKAIAEGALKVPTQPLDDLAKVPEALEQIENRSMIGKAVVRLR